MTPKRPFIVGLTGGIASGKTTISDGFDRLGVPVVDADLIARELVAPDSELLATLVAHFGPAILNDDASLNRQALRSHIFKHPEDKSWLEAQLHPAIRETIKTRCTTAEAPWVLVVVPLLLESADSYDFIDRILVVDLPEECQWQRALARDGDAQTLHAIIQSQVTRETRLAHADDIIDNSNTQDSLETELARLDAFYRQQATQSNQQNS